MRHLHDFATQLSPLLLATLLIGCSGDFMATSSLPDEESPESQDDDQRTDWMLSPVDGNTYSTPKGAGTDLKVELVDADGETRAGEAVEFSLRRDDADAALGSLRVPTGDDGIATVPFRPGSTLETYTAVASHPNASDLELYVDVVPLPKGDLAVTVDAVETEPVSLEMIRVRLFSADELTCDAFNKLDDLDDATFSQRLPSASDRARVENLEPNSEWTAVAHGYGASGKALAAGCQETAVDPGDTRNVVVPLDLLRLEPQGTYEATSYWDLRSTVAVDVPGGDRFGRIVEVLAEPAGEIFDKLADKVEETTNSLVATVVEHSDTARKIKNEIDRRIENNGVLDKLRATARGLDEAIKNLEIHSELDIGEAARDGSISGTHTWETAHVYYRENCSESDPPACGRRKIDLRSDQPDGLRDEFDGSVASFDRLNVGEHTVRVDVGHILVQTLERLIIPEMTGDAASTLEGAVRHWFDCQGMAQDLRDDGTLCVFRYCLGADTVETACRASLSWAIDTDEVIRNLLDHRASITMAGPGKLSVPNDEGVIETIEEGTFDATVQKIGRSATSDVDSDWSAENLVE